MGFWYGLILVLVLAGLIAYVGDVIGRRIGRKRLSLFGLRPRNTAIVFTVLTGIIIAAAAVTTVLLLSAGARDRLLRYDERIAELTGQAERQRQRYELARDNLQQAEADLTERTAAVERARAWLQRTERDLVDARRDVRDARQEESQAKARLATATRAVRAAQARVGRAEAERREAQARRAAAVREATAARRQVEAAQAAVDALQQDLAAAVAARGSAVRQLSGVTQELQLAELQLRRVEDNLTQRETSLEQTERALEAADLRLAALREVLQETLVEYGQTVVQEPVYTVGEELGRLRLSAGVVLDEQQVYQALRQLAIDINLTAGAAGLGRDKWQNTGLYAVPYYQEADESTPLVDEAYLRSAAAALAGFALPVILRAVALNNAVPGRPVYYALDRQIDQIAFRRGEEVARATLDGGREPRLLTQSFEAFLDQQVVPALRARNVLAALEDEHPIRPEVWVPAAMQLHALDQPARVRVVATEQIRVGDPLALMLVVEQLSDGSG